jgi:hypothetical protein
MALLRVLDASGNQDDDIPFRFTPAFYIMPRRRLQHRCQLGVTKQSSTHERLAVKHRALRLHKPSWLPDVRRCMACIEGPGVTGLEALQVYCRWAARFAEAC